MSKEFEIIFWGVLFGLLMAVPIIYLIFSVRRQETKFIENHKKIFPGMSKTQVIDILGTQYTQSFLKNNVEKLEWRFRRSGYSSRIAKGAYVHTGSLARKISVKFKNEIVIEVNSLNMD